MKIALVTGASGIIGGACARMLAKKGYALALQYHRHPEKAQALFEENGYHAVSIPFGFDEYVAACGNYYAHGATICEPCKEEDKL